MLRKFLRWLTDGRRPVRTAEEIKRTVDAYKDKPLNEVESELGITETNDVRRRAGYSKNPYYRTLSSEERDRRKNRVSKLTDAGR